MSGETGQPPLTPHALLFQRKRGCCSPGLERYDRGPLSSPELGLCSRYQPALTGPEQQPCQSCFAPSSPPAPGTVELGRQAVTPQGSLQLSGAVLLVSPFREGRVGQQPRLCRLPCALNSSSCGLPSRLVPSLLGPDGLLFSPFCRLSHGRTGSRLQRPTCQAQRLQGQVLFYPALPPKPLSLLRLTIRGKVSGCSTQRRPPDSEPARPRCAGRPPPS